MALRVAFIGIVVLFFFAGVKSVVLPAKPKIVQVSEISAKFPDASVEGFALGFARDYLTYDGARPEDHSKRVSRYLSNAVEEGAGLVIPGDAKDEISSVHLVGSRKEGETGRTKIATVTVAYRLVDDSRGYLNVTVTRDGDGRLAVPEYPSFIAKPSLDRDIEISKKDDVVDPAVVGVIRRFMRNYLAGSRTDLQADVLPGYEISPLGHMTLRELGEVKLLRNNGQKKLVSVQTYAVTESGVEHLMVYRVLIVKKQRWYVNAVNEESFKKGGSRYDSY